MISPLKKKKEGQRSPSRFDRQKKKTKEVRVRIKFRSDCFARGTRNSEETHIEHANASEYLGIRTGD